MTNLEVFIAIGGENKQKIQIQFLENMAFFGGNIDEIFVFLKLFFTYLGQI